MPVRRRLAVPVAVVALLAAGCTASPRTAARFHDGPAAAPRTSSSAGATAGTTSARTLTILGAGDELLHPQVWAQGEKDAKAAGRSGFDFDPIFADVKPEISAASLAICHMETPLAPANGPFDGYPRFSVPPQIATTLHNIGYDTCSTASNHTLDQGTAGIKRTLDALDAADVKHTGSYRTEADSKVPDIIEVTPNGGGSPVKVAQLSYTFGFNGLRRPAGEDWVANLTDPTAILAAAHAAKQAGAQIVVLSIHWGVEYSHTPNADQKALARKLLASPDIDLILGCHEHVVQPIQRIGDKWVVYGMGNQLARHANPINDNREGIMPEFTFSETSPGHWVVTKAIAIPTWVTLTPNIRVVDLLDAAATSSPSRGTYAAAVARIKKYVDSMGANDAGLTLAVGAGAK
ncbi:MAG TPA: CapA family protein [Micromonosporaceae bacterium]|nr:CapA family protein [Micromonosporaceae bacterium]